MHAHQNSEFYRKRFDEAGFNPSEIRHLEDLTKIPVTEKAELLGHRDRIQNRNGFERLFYSETSGSTGTPLVFFRSDDWDAWHNASVMRGYSWHDVSPWERNGYLWGFNLSGGRGRRHVCWIGCRIDSGCFRTMMQKFVSSSNSYVRRATSVATRQ